MRASTFYLNIENYINTLHLLINNIKFDKGYLIILIL